WLHNKGKITKEKAETYFWQGIHKSFRSRLEGRLIMQLPDHSLRDPFPIQKVVEAAEFLLERNRFDKAEDLGIDDEDSDDEESDDEDSDDEDDSDDGDSDDEGDYPRKSKKSKSRGESIINTGKKAQKTYRR